MCRAYRACLRCKGFVQSSGLRVLGLGWFRVLRAASSVLFLTMNMVSRQHQQHSVQQYQHNHQRHHDQHHHHHPHRALMKHSFAIVAVLVVGLLHVGAAAAAMMVPTRHENATK